MGRQLLLELLQDRAFCFLLNGPSSLSCKQVYKSRIDLIYYQISIAAKRFFVLRHRNGLCPCFVVTGDPPICILKLAIMNIFRKLLTFRSFCIKLFCTKQITSMGGKFR